MPETRIEQARQGGRELAGQLVTAPSGRSGRGLRARIRRLDDQFRELYRSLRMDSPGTHLHPRGESWLLENDHVVGEALDQLTESISPTSFRRLPRVREGSRKTRLRVERIAWDRVEVAQGRLELEEVSAFLRGYQEVNVLTLGELWALPTFLRLHLLEWLYREIRTVSGSDDEDGDSHPVDREGRVGSAILSLRALAAWDWRPFVEELSAVEGLLRQDPAGVYGKMDFRTRDRYRHEVEEIALQTGRPEVEVARQALQLSASVPGNSRRSHVGYYLTDQGREDLFPKLGRRAPLLALPERRRRWAGVVYFGGIALLLGLFLFLLSLWVPDGAAGLLLLGLATIPAVGVAISVVNWFSAQIVPTRTLPRMDFRDGIPEEFRTVVAVPMLLTSEEQIQEVVHTLEVNYQANSDRTLTFALLSDHMDADAASVPGDEALLQSACSAVARLNRIYGDGDEGPFLLLHRSRRWNEAEGRWMGWERKRGKLDQLNCLLLGHPSELWSAEGRVDRLRGVPFVITLDADTLLPRGAAARLVGTLAHPLNRPRIDSQGRISSGYSVLQPRLEILPEEGGGSAFFRIFGGVQGLDLYAHAAFDIYQDLFDEGIFAGKGIYDVAAFEACLRNRIPENSILSHDLFEGSHGRAGLVSDVILLEDFPDHPVAHARRLHRWVRGDWQLLPWLFPRTPRTEGSPGPNPLSALSRWKVFDNFRRSLQPPALLLFLLATWFLHPQGAGVGTVLALGVVAMPALFSLVSAITRALHHWPGLGDLRTEGRAILRATNRSLLDAAFLPSEARILLDAIVRTVDRVYRTRQRLLEWTSAAVTARALASRRGPKAFLREMWEGPVLALILVAALLILGQPPAHPFVLALLFFWLLAPGLAWLVSRPPAEEDEEVGRFDEGEARLLARRIWGFFERFQGPESHWLPPDNFQEDPNGEVAGRTSPTNIGLGLTSAVVAWDLGFLDSAHLVTRVRNTLEGMYGLPRYRGHFLNWYDVHRRQALSPRYVSTVDSGNLAAAFLVTREALRELRGTGLRPQLRARGVMDTLRVLAQVVREGAPGGASESLHGEVEALVLWGGERLDGQATGWDPASPEDLESWGRILSQLQFHQIPSLEARLAGFIENTSGTDLQVGEAVLSWLAHLRGEVTQARDELALFAPWIREARAGGEDPDEEEWELLRELAGGIPGPPPALADLPDRMDRIEGEMERALGRTPSSGPAEAVRRARETASLLLEDLERLDRRLGRWFRDMDFSFLYDRSRRLFRIGYSVTEGELDRNHYDLLASEARIASAVAVSKGDVPLSHWLHLGRPFSGNRAGPVLLSWAGTMFEYLMPVLFLRTPPESLLHDAVGRAVRVQRRYGSERGIPWGISESAYHVLDHQGHYQYRAFGVPALALRRESRERLVVAPYASLMAVAWAPGATRANLQRLVTLGGMGPWGPYEALDFGENGGKPPEGAPRVVRAYMAHHQGMILASLGNFLTGDALVERFHRDPRIRTMEPFLHERIPWRRSVERPWVGAGVPVAEGRDGVGFQAWTPAPDRRPPPLHLLTNGSYTAILGPGAQGGSHWEGWSIIRGGPGEGRPRGGPHILLLDREDGESWSLLPDPSRRGDQAQRISFLPHRADYFLRRGGIQARVGVTVAPRGDLEMREIRLVNETERPRRLRLVLWAEVALSPIDDDLRHPAFHKLFVRARGAPEVDGLLFVRRPRSPEEQAPTLAVSLLTPEGYPTSPRWEVDRARFVGRAGTAGRPGALLDPPRGTGPSRAYHPLDPLAGGTLEVELEPYEEVEFALLFAVAESEREAVQAILDLPTRARREWLELQARSRAEGELLSLGASPGEIPQWEQLLSHLLHPRTGPRRALSLATEMALDMPSLWKWGISGDHPILLMDVLKESEMQFLGTVLRAQAYWRARGVVVDVVIRDDTEGGYQDPVGTRVRSILEEGKGAIQLGGPGGVHLLPSGELTTEDRRRLEILAALHLRPDRGGITENLAALWEGEAPPPFLRPPAGNGVPEAAADDFVLAPPRDLEAPSALGGFDPVKGGYLIHLPPGTRTPAPWANVVAGDGIGFLVTESGGGFTWGSDAGEFRLTPWSNDPVLDAPGEVLYLRDEETGEIWTPTPRPLGRRVARRIRHHWGRTRLETGGGGLRESVEWFLHPEVSAKVTRVRIRNVGDTPRRLTVTFFADWVLGTHRALTSGHLMAAYDRGLDAVVVRNPFVPRFAERWAYLAADGPSHGVAVDREEFTGRADPAHQIPDGLLRVRPGDRPQPAGAPCGVIQRMLVVPPGETGTVDFFLGEGGGLEEIRESLDRLRRAPGEAGREWEERLGRLQIRTPDPALNHLMNGWLPYQTLSARIQGRTGFYQSGGAFGFRDQLQDVYTMLPLGADPAIRQLEEAARHQFEEGDVLHWWHPGTNRGVRTRCSDDLLWLPYVLAGTVRWTGRMEILERRVPFLRGEVLRDGEHERYDEFQTSEEEGTLWEHGLGAIDLACASLGERGLPLIGTGDWNDGMDRVGREGRGESIWLAWFLIRILTDWEELALRRGDEELAHRLGERRRGLGEAVERHGWDGEWYRRAFFDDGSALGSRQAPEARIDSIAQSWAIISGGADPERATMALESAWRHLVKPEEGLSLLLTPPFDGEGNHPGYIAAYPPGVRENGGQYTHAAAWLMRAMARTGDGVRTGQLLSMILPTHHARGVEGTRRYRVEPYVVAADIYGAQPHVGRGGWTWYTGSAGWIYRVVIEDILGICRNGDEVRLEPCIPPDWPEFTLSWAVEEGRLEVRVQNPEGVSGGVSSCRVEGREVAPDRIPVPSPGETLRVEVVLGGRGRPEAQAPIPWPAGRSED